MSHITRGQKGNRLEDWRKTTKECKAKSCNVCMMYYLCANLKKKMRK